MASFWLSQGERSDCRKEVSEGRSDPWYERRDVQVFNLEFLDIGQHGKSRQEKEVESFWAKPIRIATAAIDQEFLDQGK